jgi:hypothetical protein
MSALGGMCGCWRGDIEAILEYSVSHRVEPPAVLVVEGAGHGRSI